MAKNKTNLRKMTRQQRDRANAKPPADMEPGRVLHESFFGLRHSLQDGRALCGQVPRGAKWHLQDKGMVTCPACLEMLSTPAPKKSTKKTGSTTDGDAEEG